MKELVELIDNLYFKEGLKNEHRKKILNKIEQINKAEQVKNAKKEVVK